MPLELRRTTCPHSPHPAYHVAGKVLGVAFGLVRLTPLRFPESQLMLRYAGKPKWSCSIVLPLVLGLPGAAQAVPCAATD